MSIESDARPTPQPRTRSDAGLSLIELIIYLLVISLVLGGLATLLVSGMHADARTRERDAATGMAHTVTNSIQTSVRNAAASAAISEGGTLLRARVATGTAGWECRAWVLNDGSVKFRASPSAIAAAPYTEEAGWTTLATGVVGTATGGAAFVAGGARGLEIHMEITVGEASVPVTGGVAAQGAGLPGSGAEIACAP